VIFDFKKGGLRDGGYNGRAIICGKFGWWGFKLCRNWGSWTFVATFQPKYWQWGKLEENGMRAYCFGPILILPVVFAPSRFWTKHSDGTSIEHKSYEDMIAWEKSHKEITGKDVKRPFYWKRAMRRHGSHD